MSESDQAQMISTTTFAKGMGVNYRTALNWLRAGRVPGAVERKMPGEKGNIYWEIPVTALEMNKPIKPGPKPKQGAVEAPTTTGVVQLPEAEAKKHRIKRSQKKA